MLDVLNVVKFRVARQQVWHRSTTWLVQRTVRITTWLLQRIVRSPERLVNGSSSGRVRLSSDRSTPTH